MITKEGADMREGVRIKRKAQVTIPKKLMDALNLKEDDELDVYVENGRIVLEPMVRIPKDQAWFWGEEWQRAEREAEEDLKNGNISEPMDSKEALAHLKKLRKGNNE